MPQDRRADLHQNFNRVLTLPTVHDAREDFKKIRESNCPEWIKYKETYWEKKESWCLAYRNERIRGHHTNNFFRN